MNDRTTRRLVPPDPSQCTAQELVKANEPKEKAMQAPQLREPLRKDYEGEGAMVRRTTPHDPRS